MARIRSIKPEFWEDEKIASLPIPCRLFFIGLWNFSDDLGVFRSNPVILKSKIFPYDENLRVNEVKKWLDALTEARMIIPIIHKEESYYKIRTFESHQKIDKRYGRPLIEESILKELINSELNSTVSTHCLPAVYPPKEKKGEEEKKREDINPPLPPLGDGVEKTWKDDFDIYLNELRSEYKKLINDSDYISERQKYHPNLNIKLSLEKACMDYWSKEDAWLRKKKRKTNSINWKTTFNNALSEKRNQVYLQKNENKETTGEYVIASARR